MKRHATAIWQGTGKEGKGNLSTDSKVLNQTPYTYNDRFGDGSGTNPEELIAAAHAGCFSLKLSFVLGAAGFTADKLETSCEVEIENGTILTSKLTLKGTVKGISADQFLKCAEEAKLSCPVSKLLKAEISLNASLAG